MSEEHNTDVELETNDVELETNDVELETNDIEMVNLNTDNDSTYENSDKLGDSDIEKSIVMEINTNSPEHNKPKQSPPSICTQKELTDSICSTESVNHLKLSMEKINYIETKITKLKVLSDIYSQCYHDINMRYSRISVSIIILSAVLTTIEASQYADLSNFLYISYSLKTISVLMGLLITTLSAVLKFFQYKEQIEQIGRYLDIINRLVEENKILQKKIELQGISDIDFLKELKKIANTISNTHTKFFNLKSSEFKRYFKNTIKMDFYKWRVLREHDSSRDEAYNYFFNRRKNAFENRLVMEKDIVNDFEEINKNPELLHRFQKNIWDNKY